LDNDGCFKNMLAIWFLEFAVYKFNFSNFQFKWPKHLTKTWCVCEFYLFGFAISFQCFTSKLFFRFFIFQKGFKPLGGHFFWICMGGYQIKSTHFHSFKKVVPHLVATGFSLNILWICINIVIFWVTT
jgi:hypothetical protein